MNELNECKREGLKGCYCDSIRNIFKGQILDEKNGRFLFKRIFIQYTDFSGMVHKRKEDHVWIDADKFRKAGLQKGDYTEFWGEVYIYQRKNKTHELGIRNPDMIKKIKEYDLPSDEELLEQFVQQVKCATCLCAEQCCRTFCLLGYY